MKSGRPRRPASSRTPTSLSFSLYLAWPLEVADEGHVMIRQKESGLTLETDWFPDEEFDLQTFFSQDHQEIFLKGTFERENIFIHFHK